MTSSFTHSDSPIERARRAMRMASSAVRQPAVFGRIRNRFQSITSRIVFFLGSSRSRRRSATVTSSHPDASRAASIASSVVYLPVPRNSRERIATRATTRGSACVSVCTVQSLRKLANQLRPLSPHPSPLRGEGALELLLQKKRPVAGIRQALHRILDLEPLEPVDLDPGLEPPA